MYSMLLVATPFILLQSFLVETIGYVSGKTVPVGGLDIPIVPGIMPITNYTQLARFSDMCGAEIPRWIRKRLEAFGDDRAAIRTFGEDIITDMCQRLLDAGAPGLHFYSMNQANPTTAIWNNLGLSNG